MTRQKHLKQLVRDRMAKTGESYSTARRHVLAKAPVPPLPASTGPHLPGSNPATTALRARLAISGDLVSTAASAAPLPATPADLYTGDLVAAVRAFQARHGLATDGVVGTRTLAALNVPARDRIAQLELAAERENTRLVALLREAGARR